METPINSKKLLTTIANAAADKKGDNIVLLDVRGLTSYTDYLVLASGNSSRQVASIGEHIESQVGQAGGPALVGREGYEQGLWVLLDFAEVIVHIFEPEQRAIFNLEQLWSEAPKVHWDAASPPTDFFGAQEKPAVAKTKGRAVRRSG